MYAVLRLIIKRGDLSSMHQDKFSFVFPITPRLLPLYHDHARFTPPGAVNKLSRASINLSPASRTACFSSSVQAEASSFPRRSVRLSAALQRETDGAGRGVPIGVAVSSSSRASSLLYRAKAVSIPRSCFLREISNSRFLPKLRLPRRSGRRSRQTGRHPDGQLTPPPPERRLPYIYNDAPDAVGFGCRIRSPLCLPLKVSGPPPVVFFPPRNVKILALSPPGLLLSRYPGPGSVIPVPDQVRDDGPGVHFDRLEVAGDIPSPSGGSSAGSFR